MTVGGIHPCDVRDMIPLQGHTTLMSAANTINPKKSSFGTGTMPTPRTTTALLIADTLILADTMHHLFRLLGPMVPARNGTMMDGEHRRHLTHTSMLHALYSSLTTSPFGVQSVPP